MVEKRGRQDDKGGEYNPGLPAAEDAYLDQLDQRIEALRAELADVRLSHKHARRKAQLRKPGRTDSMTIPELISKFNDFDAVLDFVNPGLERSADMLEETSHNLSASLAAMEARAQRIDRTQAETRVLLNRLIEGG